MITQRLHEGLVTVGLVRMIVSGLQITRLWRLVFSAEASRDLLRYAASLLVERSATQVQGMSSSRREAGQRLTSLVSTSVK